MQSDSFLFRYTLLKINFLTYNCCNNYKVKIFLNKRSGDIHFLFYYQPVPWKRNVVHLPKPDILISWSRRVPVQNTIQSTSVTSVRGNVVHKFTNTLLGRILERANRQVTIYLVQILLWAAIMYIIFRWLKPSNGQHLDQKVWELYEMEQITYATTL